MSTRKAQYLPKEKEKMDAILKAFNSYICEHHYFDILYSEKCGYVYVVIVDPDFPVFLKDSSDLLSRLFMNVSYDVIALHMNASYKTDDLSPEEAAEVRRRLLVFIESLDPDIKEFCVKKMDEYLSS